MIVFRYLAKEVYTTMLAATCVLLLIFICNQFVHYLDSAAGGHLTARSVMQLMGIQVPFLLGWLLPVGLYLGIVVAYGRLYADNEMTVLFACGVSRLKLLGMTIGLASVVFVVVAFLMLWLQPKLAGYRFHVIAQAIASPVEKMAPARFTSVPNTQWVFYVKSLSRNHKEMKNVFLAKVPGDNVSGQDWQIMSAKNGYQKLDHKTGNRYLVFNEGHRYVGRPG